MGGVRSFLDRLPLLNTLAWASGEAIHRSADAVRRYQQADAGTHELSLSPSDPPGISNPVLTAYDVPDFGGATFVADPFLVPRRGIWHLFFEVYNQHRSPSGAIGHAVSRDRGATWGNVRTILREDDHLSFPYVFANDGQYYMLPECAPASGDAIVKLYAAADFPTEWSPVDTLLRPAHGADDTVVFTCRDRWWLLCGDKSIDGVYAYYAESLHGDWRPHAENPVVSGRPSAATPAGRPIVRDDDVVLFYQDCAGRYGRRVRAYTLSELTPEAFVECEHEASPVLEGSGRFGWRGIMHHLDARRIDGEWVCAVDGNIAAGYRLFGQRHWAIGIFKS